MPFGVSNSFKRGTMKTYSRQPNRFLPSNHDDELPRKRIRMDERGMVQETTDSVPQNKFSTRSSIAFSSPPPSDSPALFSSDPPTHETSLSPPSSPPPRMPSPPKLTRKPTFSFLKRKRASTTSDQLPTSPLTETTSTALNAPKSRPVKKARLTQMQIDLGGEIRRACKGCGMDFIPSNAEDAALHKEFHSMDLKGVDMGRGFVKEVKMVGRVEEGEVVVVVDGKCALGVRRRTQRVLEVVNKDLGAVDIEDGVLWGRGADVEAIKKAKGKKSVLRTSTIGEEEREARFKVFLYLDGDRCVGLCLAERIRNASKVVAGSQVSEFETETATRSSAIVTEVGREPALLGISRIWTSKSHRRKGIASALLNCARGSFFYGIEVPKEMVAFSQPSESGGMLAESWFGKRSGWHVYTEE